MFVDEACEYLHLLHRCRDFTYRFRTDYHCLVALSEACIGFIVQREQDSAEFTQHLTRGLQLVNAKLSGVHALSDLAICTVILLCLVSSIRKLPSQTKVHFDGLCRMINLRGGLDQLKENPFLTEKAHRYVSTSSS
jgi:hypothetical protein